MSITNNKQIFEFNKIRLLFYNHCTDIIQWLYLAYFNHDKNG